MAIKSAVFPVAGRGSRFMPVTKAIPKEMLPVVDKPLIQYAVEEAVSAGMTELIFITNGSKQAIETHFTADAALENFLAHHCDEPILGSVKAIIPDNVTFHYLTQPVPLGLGDAVRLARDYVGNQPFAVLLPDDWISHGESEQPTCLQQMVDCFDKQGGTIVAARPVAPAHIHRYGIVDIVNPIDLPGDIARLIGIVEKPSKAEAPSNYGVVGRYILSPDIFDWLERIDAGSGGEIQLTDAIACMIDSGVYAYHFFGQHYDCGNKLGYLKANVYQALHEPEFKEVFWDFLQQSIAIPS